MRSRSKKLFAIVIGLVLVGWMGVAWNRARHVAVRELELPAIPLPTENDPAVGAVAVTPPAAPKSDDAVASTQRAGPAEEEALTGVLSVVSESDHRPAAGADVFWFGSAQLADGRWHDDLDELGMGLDFFRRNGRHFVTDENGMARVPSSGGRIQVVATTPTQFGMTTIDRRAGLDETITVNLRAAFGVDVLVRGAQSHEPVRDVVVVASCSQLPQSRVGGRSDERGIAHLYPLFHEDDPRGNWYAELSGVFFEGIRAPLPMVERSEPLELLLPESAPAVVRIVDKQRQLCALSGVLMIGWNDREGDPAEPRQFRITNGIANLTRIERGLTLHVRAEISGTTETPTSVFTHDKSSTAPLRFDLVLENKPTATKD